MKEFMNITEVKKFLESLYDEEFALSELKEALEYGTIFAKESELDFFYNEDTDSYMLEGEDLLCF